MTSNHLFKSSYDEGACNGQVVYNRGYNVGGILWSIIMYF